MKSKSITTLAKQAATNAAKLAKAEKELRDAKSSLDYTKARYSDAEERERLEFAQSQASILRGIQDNILSQIEALTGSRELPAVQATPESNVIEIETDYDFLRDLPSAPDGIVILAKNLYQMVKAVAGKASMKSRFPILSHIRLAITPDGLECNATDLEKWGTSRTRFYNRHEHTLVTCVPAKTFTDWLKIAADYKDVLTLTLDEQVQVLTVKSAGTRATFKCMDAAEFPAIPS